MIAVVQRVLSARVETEGEVVGAIGAGLLVLLGVARGDAPVDAAWLAARIPDLRIFPDERGRISYDLSAAGGSVLCVSQFTLLADLSHGRRPGFSGAEDPEPARLLWEEFCRRLDSRGVACERGRFGADMRVSLVNDGPFTLVLDSRDRPAAFRDF